MWFREFIAARGIITIKIVMPKAHLPGRCLSGSSPLLKFFLLLFILLSCLSWLSRWTLWLCRISCRFSKSLLSRIVGQYDIVVHQRHSYSFPLRSRWGCADQCTVSHLFLLLPWDILSILPETICGIWVCCRYPP